MPGQPVRPRVANDAIRRKQWPLVANDSFPLVSQKV